MSEFFNGSFALKYLTGENFFPDRASIVLVFKEVTEKIIKEDGSIRETEEPKHKKRPFFVYFENEGWSTTKRDNGEKNIEPVFFYDKCGCLMIADDLGDCVEDDYRLEFELMATKPSFERWLNNRTISIRPFN